MHVKSELEKISGNTITDEALRDAIKVMNRSRKARRAAAQHQNIVTHSAHPPSSQSQPSNCLYYTRFTPSRKSVLPVWDCFLVCEPILHQHPSPFCDTVTNFSRKPDGDFPGKKWEILASQPVSGVE